MLLLVQEPELPREDLLQVRLDTVQRAGRMITIGTDTSMKVIHVDQEKRRPLDLILCKAHIPQTRPIVLTLM